MAEIVIATLSTAPQSMLLRVKVIPSIFKPQFTPLTPFRRVSIPYRKMAGVPSTYDGAHLPSQSCVSRCLPRIQRLSTSPS
jgi:hypothetical protein